jgi:putative nucleotidyltransferase with HDIG domain/PAS domain S-box-containing protein
MSPDGTILRATGSFLEMIGYDRRDVVGRRRFAELVHGAGEGKKFEVLCLDARRRGPVENVEIALKKMDGALLPASVDLRSLDGASGKLRARVEDITYVKEKERGLVRSRDAYFNMMKDLHSSLTELRDLLDGLMHAFANAIDAKSHWTRGHSDRVAEYSIEIAREMGLSKADTDNLKTAALLHDIGKIGTYDEILDKPEKLTPGEYELVKKHPGKGIDILSPIKKMKDVLPIIIHHHEQVDGGGYPDGLKDGEIPLPARILSAADSYDSMIAERPYRPPLGKEYAVGELKRRSGTQFDPEVVKAFLRVLERSDGDRQGDPAGTR